MALKNSTRALKKECAWILEQAQVIITGHFNFIGLSFISTGI